MNNSSFGDFKRSRGEKRSSVDGDEDVRYERSDSDDADEDPRFTEIARHLDETLEYDTAIRAFRCRHGRDPRDDDEFELMKNELIAEAINAGYDEWDPEFLEFE